ncbi:MAG: pentapeptide repeat-containing protein [Nostoc sp. DcaGUA01]|nr:pentapeptide repeat-containing protein [Nostoc sp. DcaGUA01]
MDAKELLDLYQQGQRNFQGVDLKDQSFKKQNLKDINFSQAKLQGSNFKEANLQGSNFIGAELQGAKFIEANLQGAKFNGSNIRSTDFRDATLTQADFSKSEAGLINHKIIPKILNYLVSQFSLLWSFICVILSIVLIWIYYSSLNLDLPEEPEKLQYHILIFFIFILGFLNYIIVNYRQGTKAALVIIAVSALAILLLNFKQPVILFIVWVLILVKLFILSINLTAILDKLIDKLIPKQRSINHTEIISILLLFGMPVLLLLISGGNLFIACLILLEVYTLLSILKVSYWISSISLQIILFILWNIYLTYIAERIVDNYNNYICLLFTLLLTISAVLSNITVTLLIYRYCFLGWQKIYAIIFTLFCQILLFTAFMLILMQFIDLSKLDRDGWFYIVGFVIIYLLASIQGIHAGLCTLQVDKRYIWIRKLANSLITEKVTDFQDADLTEANFSEAELKNTDFRGANLKHVDWTGAKNINLAYIEASYLQSRHIQKLVVVDRKAKDKNA